MKRKYRGTQGGRLGKRLGWRKMEKWEKRREKEEEEEKVEENEEEEEEEEEEKQEEEEEEETSVLILSYSLTRFCWIVDIFSRRGVYKTPFTGNVAVGRRNKERKKENNLSLSLSLSLSLFRSLFTGSLI